MASAAINTLTLTDFRSYAHARLETGGASVYLFGANGAGKTNLLEAIRTYAERFDLVVENLDRRALQWSQLRGARSGRVAWQFIRDLAGELGKGLPA